jgi:uncharacterized membrane protein
MIYFPIDSFFVAMHSLSSMQILNLLYVLAVLSLIGFFVCVVGDKKQKQFAVSKKQKANTFKPQTLGFIVGSIICLPSVVLTLVSLYLAWRSYKAGIPAPNPLDKTTS